MVAEQLPLVAVVGRPNVGKSTLFNRIIGEQAAIVEDRPGVTRDRKVLEAEWLGVPFRIVDTGGWMPGSAGSTLDAKVSRQVEAAVGDADVVLFVVDAAVGVTDDDEAVADWLRRGDHDVILVANKADNDRRENESWEFMALGLGEPYPVSALHGRRAGDLLDVVVDRFAPDGDVATATTPGDRPTAATATSSRRPRASTLPAWPSSDGPNVGKSTLFNRLVGHDRSVVHDLPGTTRDAIDTLVDTEDGPIVFVDTAGMRRRSRIDDSAEYYSLVRALRAIDDADIALLVIDATEGVTGQDQRLAERVDASGCPVVVMLNKWELLTDPEDRLVRLADLSRRLAFIGDAPVLKISALTGKGVHRLRPVLQEAITQYHRRVPTKDVNRVLADAQQRQPAAGRRQGAVRRAGGQRPADVHPVRQPRSCPSPYLRYLERAIREAFDFGSTPIKLRVPQAR